MDHADRRLRSRHQAMLTAQATARAALAAEIRRQYDGGRTLESIGRVLGMSRQRVHALAQEADK